MRAALLLLLLLPMAGCDPDGALDRPATALPAPPSQPGPTADPHQGEWASPRPSDESLDVLKATPDF